MPAPISPTAPELAAASVSPSAPTAAGPRDPEMEKVARDLATSFLTEMLKAAKLTDALGAENEMSGTFHTMILSEIASDMTLMGGPLVDQLYTSLSARKQG